MKITIPQKINLHLVYLGSFEIVIEPEDTEVSVRYDISIDKSNINNSSIILSSVKNVDTDMELIETEESVYTGVIPLSEIEDGYSDTIEITFIWENEENSQEDIITGMSEANPTIQIPISVTVSQYMGEPIEQKSN